MTFLESPFLLRMTTLTLFVDSFSFLFFSFFFSSLDSGCREGQGGRPDGDGAGEMAHGQRHRLPLPETMGLDLSAVVPGGSSRHDDEDRGRKRSTELEEEERGTV